MLARCVMHKVSSVLCRIRSNLTGRLPANYTLGMLS
jgi:hypothetical protein